MYDVGHLTRTGMQIYGRVVQGALNVGGKCPVTAARRSLDCLRIRDVTRCVSSVFK